MEFMRIETDSAAGPTEVLSQGFDTPTSKTEKMAMLIHQIHLFCPVAKTAEGEVKVAVSDHELTLSSDVDLGEPGVITKMECFVLSTPTEVQSLEHRIQYFSPPILYAKRQIWLTVAVAGATGKRASATIGYTLEKVSQEDFISALVEG
jgi:hypothetical protein